MKLTTQLIVALSVMALAFAIIYSAITLSSHNALLSCNNLLIKQALNEAFHHAPLKLPPSCV